jgi:hypothetical protein
LRKKVAEGFLGQFLKGHQDRIVERGEDSVAVIEMSPESWFVVGIVPGISRAPLQKLHRWREEASTWLWPVNVGPMWTELTQAIDPTGGTGVHSKR